VRLHFLHGLWASMAFSVVYALSETSYAGTGRALHGVPGPSCEEDIG
jgi:hypothetical protein